MNRKADDCSKLMAEAIHGDWDAGPIAQFARAAATHARRRRRTRQGAAVAALVTAIAAILIVGPSRPMDPEPLAVAPRTEATDPGYEIISDQELLAQLEGQPILIVKHESGESEIVVLGN